jgi:S1-C subfamily serine protease
MNIRRPHIRRRAAVAAIAALAAAGVTAGFALASTSATKRSATTGVVVIETTLGYQGGEAAGTGMVLTSSGEVLTNNHVIEGATSIRVTVPATGKTYTATVVGYEVSDDVAVLQLRGASGLQTVALGSAAAAKVGRLVRAVGNAGGTGTLTAATGRITGLARTITATDGQGQGEQLTGLIETNANVQAGDSGGPLLNASGQVIGMDTAASQTFAGFRFEQQSAPDAYAIPINRAVAIAKQIVAGKASSTVHIGGTAFLGVGVASSGYGDSTGAVITGVVSGSPADDAGLVAGGEITAIDGKGVASPNALVTLLLRHKPGDTVTLTVVGRAGVERSVAVTLGSGPAQ